MPKKGDYPQTLKEVMTENSAYHRGNLKRRLLTSGELENKCEICGLDETWNGSHIVMVLDHINGVKDDHRRENLRMVCPNCNSQLPTHAGRNTKRARAHVDKRCIDCGALITSKSTRCYSCASLARSKPHIKWPDLDVVKQMVDDLGFVGTGRELGVSDNAVRKHIKVYEGKRLRLEADNGV